MAYEILNVAQVTPARLRSLLTLVVTCGDLDKKGIISLLEPSESSNPGSPGHNVLEAAAHLGLVSESADGTLKCKVKKAELSTVDLYREVMQGVILGVTQERKDNFVFNSFTAWYSVMGSRVFEYSRSDLVNEFNRKVFPKSSSEIRDMNDEKFRGWRSWASFLGFGVLGAIKGPPLLLPNAKDRIAPLLKRAKLAGKRGQSIPISEFVSRLAEMCPELDGGVLFRRMQRILKDRATDGKLSLMTSAALCSLERDGSLSLLNVPDSQVTWQLSPGTHLEHQEISHIAVKEL